MCHIILYIYTPPPNLDDKAHEQPLSVVQINKVLEAVDKLSGHYKVHNIDFVHPVNQEDTFLFKKETFVLKNLVTK